MPDEAAELRHGSLAASPSPALDLLDRTERFDPGHPRGQLLDVCFEAHLRFARVIQIPIIDVATRAHRHNEGGGRYARQRTPP